ncbi:MAG: hypothetical protein JO267_06990 [Alphaproteobacteria bacterium]|nr:hypothetical protein [Alphaproteobacteria bacterium]
MSHTQVQWGRGTTAQVAAYTGPQGEIVVNTDDYSLAVQDGATAGGAARLVPYIPAPQGRLTLASATPVLSSNTGAAGTVYYTPYVGGFVPLYNGTVWQSRPFAELSLALDGTSGHAGYQAAGSLYDLFLFSNAGVLALGTGPAWSSGTARGSGAGTTQLQMLNGIWTNAVTIALRFGNAAGNTVSVAVNQATYVGTMVATANGQTAMQFAPAAAAGGGNPTLGLYNAFNRVRIQAQSQDSTASWSYNGSYRAANNSTANRVTWVDGLGQSVVEARYAILASGGAPAQAFVTFDATGAPAATEANGMTAAGDTQLLAFDRMIGLGLHYAQAVEWSGGTAGTFYGQSSGNFTKLETILDL